MSRADESEYLLGVNAAELERLRFQHEVWSRVTHAFFDRLGVGLGWDCLDVGAGPGFVTLDLLDRVGSPGSVTALEPAQLYATWLEAEAARRGFANLTSLVGSAETAELGERQFDLVFSRWVIGFVPDPERFLMRLVKALKPGGILAIQDYGSYDTTGLYPRGGPADGIAEAVKAYWRSGGGDPYIATRLPGLYRKLGLTPIDFTPTCLGGGPGAPIGEWAHRFLSVHIPIMAERGLLDAPKAEAMLADWLERRGRSDVVFLSPVLVDVAARAPR